MEDDILLETRPFEGCVVLTMNRPRVRNALSLALRRDLVAALRRLEAEPGPQVVVLTGAGTAFCAGVDMKELGRTDPSLAVVPDEDLDPVAAMARYPWPVIGAINGPAITGGFELALACDLLVAASTAVFADTHGRVGLLPGWGLSQRLPRLLGPWRAKELSFTGNFLGADKAEAWGLVNRTVAPEALLDTCLQLARDMAGSLPSMLTGYKRLIDEGMRLDLGAALDMERTRSLGWAREVRGDEIEQRRGAIVARGRGLAEPGS